jgi:hypothetical protein
MHDFRGFDAGLVNSFSQALHGSLYLRQVGGDHAADVGILKRPVARPRDDTSDILLGRARYAPRQSEQLVPQLIEFNRRTVAVAACTFGVEDFSARLGRICSAGFERLREKPSMLSS